jgi:hypothetical protein
MGIFVHGYHWEHYTAMESYEQLLHQSLLIGICNINTCSSLHYTTGILFYRNIQIAKSIFVNHFLTDELVLVITHSATQEFPRDFSTFARQK